MCRSVTRARASPRSTCHISSSCSSRPKSRRALAWAYGCRKASSRPTAGPSNCAVAKVVARRSTSLCPSEARPSMTTASLLVVDDEESVAVTMGAILEMDGYRVSISTSGTDAIRKLHESEFDLVLTDLRLDDAAGLS